MSNIFKKPIIPNIRFNRIIVFPEYSLKPNIRPNIRIKPNIRLNRIFVLVIFKKINFYYFNPKITLNIRFFYRIFGRIFGFDRLFKILFFSEKITDFTDFLHLESFICFLLLLPYFFDSNPQSLITSRIILKSPSTLKASR
jgi:hypothetical protein